MKNLLSNLLLALQPALTRLNTLRFNPHVLPASVQQIATQARILTQNLLKIERKLKLRWVLALSTVPLFGIFAAFGLAPQTAAPAIAPVTITEEMPMPALSPTAAQSTAPVFWYKEVVRRDDTLTKIFTRLHITHPAAQQFIKQDAVAKEMLTALKPGHQIEAKISEEGHLLWLDYQLNDTEAISIHAITSPSNKGEAQNGLLSAQKIQRTLVTRPVLKSAEIKHSLFGATDAADIPDYIAVKIADIFEKDIDFNADLRRGDHFNVVYEGGYENGQLVKTGDILAIEFTHKGKTYRAVGFRDDEQAMQYYSPEGESLHKSFLRTPLEFSRISSNFSAGRFHPILQRIKAHKGVDLAAPTGTGIKAVGDAVVDFVGVKGGYGNVIVLQHENEVSTVYGHLSRFVAGIKKGQKIKQGDLIGFVGMTGLATGPHLHYEFLVKGTHQDPMTVALPKANPITAETRAAFNAASKQAMGQLALLGNSNIAALD